MRDALSRDLEAARYAVDRAFRQYDADDPANRLMAGELEARWNRALAHVAEVEGKIAMHDAAIPAPRCRSSFAWRSGLEPQNGLGCADDGGSPQEADFAHRYP